MDTHKLPSGDLTTPLTGSLNSIDLEILFFPFSIVISCCSEYFPFRYSHGILISPFSSLDEKKFAAGWVEYLNSFVVAQIDIIVSQYGNMSRTAYFIFQFGFIAGFFFQGFCIGNDKITVVSALLLAINKSWERRLSMLPFAL